MKWEEKMTLHIFSLGFPPYFPFPGKKQTEEPFLSSMFQTHLHNPLIGSSCMILFCLFVGILSFSLLPTRTKIGVRTKESAWIPFYCRSYSRVLAMSLHWAIHTRAYLLLIDHPWQVDQTFLLQVFMRSSGDESDLFKPWKICSFRSQCFLVSFTCFVGRFDLLPLWSYRMTTLCITSEWLFADFFRPSFLTWVFAWFVQKNCFF